MSYFTSVFDMQASKEGFPAFLESVGFNAEGARCFADMIENTRRTGANQYQMGLQDGIPKCKRLSPNVRSFEEWVVDNKAMLQTIYK